MADELERVLRAHQAAFRDKEFTDAESDSDPLMDVFGITPSLKAANRQYWGRELGMCWQRLCVAVCSTYCKERYSPPKKEYGGDEPYDLQVDKLAIDTKYRIGSGDAGTLKKFKTNGQLLRDEGLTPTMFILRSDNLAAAITACRTGGWDVRIGGETFSLLSSLTGGFDLEAWLIDRRGKFPLSVPTPEIE
jgi:hypothetical protein